MLFLLIIASASLPIEAADPNTLHVDDGADPEWYDAMHVKTIQEGIDNATIGDTVFVYNGTYTENVIVNKSVTIIGESTSNVQLYGRLLGTNIVEIQRDGISLKNLTISILINTTNEKAIFNKGNNTDFTNLYIHNVSQGIYLSSNCTNVSIENNTIENNTQDGIYVDNTSNVLIENNVIRTNSYGIHCNQSGENITIANNVLASNNHGIYIYDSTITVHTNFIQNNIHGVNLEEAEQNLIYNNYFSNAINANPNNTIGTNHWNISKTWGINILGGPYLGGNYWDNYTGIDEDGDGLGDTVFTLGLVHNDTDSLPLIPPNLHLYVDDNADSEWYNETNVHTIQEAINNATVGASIYVYNGNYSQNIIVNKTVDVSGESIQGVYVTNETLGYTFNVTSDNVRLQNLTIAENYEDDGGGIAIYDISSNANYRNIHICNNSYGIYLPFSSNGSLITKCLVERNANSGVYLEESSNHIIIENNISNNTIGMILDSSQDNLIYNNYFDNDQNANIIGEVDVFNHLNRTIQSGTNIIGGETIGGNYWNDYAGIDTDGDGIGEQAYYIGNSTLSVDQLPLTNNLNYSPILGISEPTNGNSNLPLHFGWYISINDSEGDILDWNISCSNGQSNRSQESLNGTKKLYLDHLSYSTTYTVWVNVSDYISWTNQTYIFTTKNKPPSGRPGGGNIDINKRPVAVINSFSTGVPGETIDFNGNESYDPDGNIVLYEWTLGDGTHKQGSTITHIYNSTGAYNVSLTVTDNEVLTDTTTISVTITTFNYPPQLDLNYVINDTQQRLQITLTASDPDGDNVDCIIYWNDGDSLSQFTLADGQTIQKTYRYPSVGNYTVEIIASDNKTTTHYTRNVQINPFDDDSPPPDPNNSTAEESSHLLNKNHRRSIVGMLIKEKYAIPLATAISILLLFLLNLLVEFFSDYSSEKTLDKREKLKSKFLKRKPKKIKPHSILNRREITSVGISALLFSFVITWTWVPDLSSFWEMFGSTIIIVLIFQIIRESLRVFLCRKENIGSDYYVWPLGAVMMIVSTFIGNTFSLAADHTYEDYGNAKRVGRVTFIVSLIMYLVVLVGFIICIYHPNTLLQILIIAIILNLFIDLFPLRPMDGYEARRWNIFLWGGLYIVVFISYVVIYFNLYP